MQRLRSCSKAVLGILLWSLVHLQLKIQKNVTDFHEASYSVQNLELVGQISSFIDESYVVSTLYTAEIERHQITIFMEVC
jgi:hypothetical protein